MKEESKTHYRKVFKSDHLGVADLEDFVEEGKDLHFVIDHVKQEIGVSVAGRKGNHNIAYFKQSIKPLVLNATNSKRVKAFAGGSPFVEDWKDVPVTLYIDNSVKMKGEVVGGVRISPQQPKIGKPKPMFTKDNFESAKNAGADIAKVKTVYSTTPEIEKEYINYLKDGAGK